MSSRAVSSWCNLDAQIQLKDKHIATSPGNGSVSGFKDLVRDRRAELGNHWEKYIRESQRTPKTSPHPLRRGYWSYSRVEVKKNVLFLACLSNRAGSSSSQDSQIHSLMLNPLCFPSARDWCFSSSWRCYLSPSPMPDKKSFKVILNQSGWSSG